MTDLSKLSVAELREHMIKKRLSINNALEAFDELAQRLEEAQRDVKPSVSEEDRGLLLALSRVRHEIDIFADDLGVYRFREDIENICDALTRRIEGEGR